MNQDLTPNSMKLVKYLRDSKCLNKLDNVTSVVKNSKRQEKTS